VPHTAPLPIAIVMTSFEPGGTERQMIELVRRLDPSRWEVHVACFRRGGGWYGRVAQTAVSVAEFPLASFKSPEAARQLWAFARWCRQRRIAVVHATAMPSNIFALPGAALARVPVRIGNRREINPDKSVTDLAMQRAGYACAHKVIANSAAAAERLVEERVPRQRIAVIPNGLDVVHFRARAPRGRIRRVAVVANLRPEKGHDVLIDAAPEILRRFPDAHVDLVGGAITFHGHCEDVAARLDEADLFVLPSRSEAFPNAVLEAMGAGLPVVASGVGGIRELIDHEQTGLLVPPGDPRALARQICRLMADPALAGRLAASARTRVQTRYSFERMVAAFEGVYLDELARRGVIRAPRPQLAESA
jgi:glycosyltransferase involved in cell wall biosynthesis